MRPIAAAALLMCVAPAAIATSAAAQDAPLLAGLDVEAPRRTKFVRPEYPPEASVRGLRGIVILELIIDEQGSVSEVDVVRSVPPFDEAAVTAARQWEYELTRIEGKPVKVRLTVPITFAIRLPEMRRERGIPELRQGISPPIPRDAEAGQATARLTLTNDGQVVDALIESGEAPWADALLLAISTWHFAPAEGGGPVSFRAVAEFVPAKDDKEQGGSVRLRLTDLQRLEALPDVATGDPGPAAPAAEADDAATSAAEATTAEPAREAEAPSAPAAKSESPAAGSREQAARHEAETLAAFSEVEPAEGEARAEQPEAGPEPGAGSEATAPASDPAAADTQEPPQPAAAAEEPEAPATEVISSPVRRPTAQPTPAPRPERPGISSVSGVALANGVPDLSDGRTPVVPPFARMAGASGTLRVRFSVDSAGVTTVGSVEGPDLLQLAAGQAVESWKFRRETAERLRLIAVIIYEGDSASATVTLQE